MPESTLFGRFLPPLLALLGATVILLGWVADAGIEAVSPEQGAARLRREAAGLAPVAGQILATGQEAGCGRLAGPDVEWLALVAADGRVLCATGLAPEGYDRPAERQPVRGALAGDEAWALEQSRADGMRWAVVALPLAANSAQPGALVVGRPLPPTDEARSTLFLRLLAVGALVLALGLGLAFWLAWGVGKGFSELRATAKAYAGGQLRRRPPALAFREGRELGQALQEMAAGLEERLETFARRQGELEAVLAGMAEGVVAVDREERVLDLNATAAELFGVELAQARGRYLLEVVRLPALLRFVTATLNGEGSRESEIEVEHGGEAARFEVHGTVLQNPNGGKIGALVVLHDVTRLRRLETVRRDFVANVSHELKTPITAIKGFVETLQGGAVNDPEEAERFLAIISRHAERLNNIIEDLLDLSRVEQEAEKGAIPLSTGPLSPVLKAALQTCENKAAKKGVSLVLTCPPALTGTINAPLLEQAVVNLVDNAIKYGGDGGEVEVEAGEEGNLVFIRVRDHGPGIPEANQGRLFERFYRIDRARSRDLGGTGLGLAIVKHIAQAHGGQVEVKSTPGAGATFSLHFPARPPGGPPAAAGP